MAAVMDLFGIEWVEQKLAEGVYLQDMAAEVGITLHALLLWLNGDPNRAATFTEARRRTAQMWEERAAEVLQSATTKFELAKARELAHHYRWRASKIAPRQYGDRLLQEVTSPDGSMTPGSGVDLAKVPDDVLKALMDARTSD